MSGKIQNILSFLSQPKAIVFGVAVLNYLWFLYHSRIVQEFGSTAISFCCYCAWYWDWSLTNLPSLSLFVASLMLFKKWQAYLAACLVSAYQIVEGINWIWSKAGLLNDLQRRAEIISKSSLTSFSEINSFWTLLDVQYFFAVLIFVIGSIYLAKSLFDKYKTTKNVLA